MSSWNNDILFFAKKLKNETNLGWNQIAEIVEIDFSVDTSEFVDFPGALRKAVQRRDDTALLIDTLPEPTPKQFPSILTLPESNVLVIGDLHISYYDRDFLKVALHTAERYNCTGIIFPGDFFNMEEYSTHPKDEPVVPFRTELEMAGKVLRVLGNLPWVEYLAFTQGNHDARIFKKLNTYLGMENLIHAAIGENKVKAKIYCTDRDYLFHGKKWAFGHLSSYHKIGGMLAYEQSKKFNRYFGVFHDHRQGIVSDQTHLGISVGSLLIEDSQFYKERRLSKFDAFTNGFLIVANDVPYLYSKQGLHPMCKGD